ncbi:UPF0496 protein 4 [Tripterygium wilfordii]|uniref:UPF0496 protein 4 n=1 Tax=Tripterygium wilfordii TaxID=458696 RepID=A0A7J7DUH9_TRIWF|nr:UPF0496 protein 4-like [Tripterygium wilfordii]KAF5750015.1 UPF0496 protein 4 [Tripterygium wilfordii]
MYLTEISNFPSSFSLFKKTKAKTGADGGFDFISRSFDESLLRRLKTLDPPAISLSWLSKAVDFLSFVHSEAKTLVSRLEVASFDESLALYLEDSAKVLDLCNFISSEIERIRHRRLSIGFAIHLLTTSESGRNLEKLRRARDLLSGSVNGVGYPEVKKRRFGIGSDGIKDLVKELALRLERPPRGKISSANRLVRRTIYAVGLVTVFVAGAVVAALHRSTELISVRAPSDFSWADSVNGLEAAISTELSRRFADKNEKKAHFSELDDVERQLKELSDVIDDVTGGESVENKNKEESFDGVVKKLERVTEVLIEGLDGLSNGVNGLFNTVLSHRNGMLGKWRVDIEKK